MARQTAFAGRDYAKEPQGSVESVQIDTRRNKKYWQSIFTRSKMVIVIVGDVDKEQIEKKVKEFLSKVPAGSPFKLKRRELFSFCNSFNPKERENATNYIQGITGAPLPGHLTIMPLCWQ
jgi:predicted Zn-dependent peptidase